MVGERTECGHVPYLAAALPQWEDPHDIDFRDFRDSRIGCWPGDNGGLESPATTEFRAS